MQREQSSWFGISQNDRELKDEARFLEACGTIAGTPAEIRKASEKLEESPSCRNDSEHSRFHSWLPNTSVEKLQLDVQHFDLPTPRKLCEEWGNRTDSLERTPRSIICSAQVTQCDSVDSTKRRRTGSLHTAVRTCDNPSEKNAASVSPWLSATEIQRRNKSVHFECDTDVPSCEHLSEYSGRHLKKNESPNNQSMYNHCLI